MPTGSKIFSGYRALGFVSDHVPLAARYNKRLKENYVITSVGRSFHTYNCSKLGITNISDRHPDNISCIAVTNRYVFTGCGKDVRAFKRSRQLVHTFEGHTNEVHLLLPFGSHLISVDIHSNLKIWDVENGGVYLEMEFSNSTFHITALMHPSTYLNKVVLGSKQGTLQLWNVLKDKMLYSFNGWSSSVTFLQQSPAIDVIAVGLSDGRAILHNIKYDETVMQFQQDWGPVSAISFRTDGHPIMVTGSTAGHIALWNLEEKKLQSQIRHAHQSTVSGMSCLPSEPLMVTSAADNSLKVWIFDLPDGGGRLLRQRSGHSAPPNTIYHYDNNGKNILSAGQDSVLRSFSTIHESESKSLGRASYNKSETKKAGLLRDRHMMPPITVFAADVTRASDWDNIVACHRGLAQVTTWNYQRGTMGKFRLCHPRFQEKQYQSATAQCVDISSCGNFCVIGYSSGHVDKYNLQSGIHRGAVGDRAHECGVVGVAVDGMNQVLVTAGLDGEIRFWGFKKHQKIDSIHTENYISRILLHRESSMMAVALDNFQIIVVDLDTRRVVRKFQGHSNKVTGLSFSPDARWLISSAMDCTVRTWDVPSGRLVDCFSVEMAVTSLSMSPSADFLVTSHVDSVGVYTWYNKTLLSHVSLAPLSDDYQPQEVEMPDTRSTGADDSQTGNDDSYPDESEDYASPEQLSSELVTLSLLPNSRWQNLLNLDIIKMRNKPKEPPKVPKAAPFFLPTIPGLQPKFAAPGDTVETGKKKSEVDLSRFNALGELGRRLEEGKEEQSALGYLKQLGPSAVDNEIRCLGPDSGGSVSTLCLFLYMVSHTLDTKRDFELGNAYLGLFLKIHGEMVSSHPELLDALREVKGKLNHTWNSVQDLFTLNLTLLTHLRTAKI
ncbi:WD repeat-containing protein 36-like [Ostrea edulis]|uniref:WD repeat-containing protein 36-like n=1 Tax=Ostrea edulis TaxID=37623 RepID=UPI002094CF66|nr:WD repeat-containing protein 36-like [Ostrea edulis]